MAHGTAGKVFDRIDLIWRDPDEMRAVRALREEISFLKRQNQGEIACPMYIRDGMDPVQSMLDGQMYDSKSTLRRTYRQGGVEEVGNDPGYTDPSQMRRYKDPRTSYEKAAEAEARRGSVERAFSLANLTTSTPGDDVKLKKLDTVPGQPERFHGMK